MNQHEWVYGCYAYYLENYIEPGNPEDGVWEAAHWPVPACKGGTKTVLLLKEHHAVHGALQSEEWQYPCIFGWEKKYLSGEMLALYKKWKTKLALIANANRTPEQRSEYARRANAAQGAKGRSERVRRANASLTPEQRSAIARKRRAAQLKSTTPEQRSEAMRKANINRSKEKMIENGKQAAVRLQSQRWKCLVTGKVTNAGSLTTYQRARGIDPSLRERVQ